MLILSFILCGWFMYLLVYNLTKDVLSGITAGIIFAFCSFRFDQLGHLHILSCQWMPLTLLFLHKMLENPVKKRLYEFGFGFFFFLQFISSVHNGIYLSIAVFLFLMYFAKDIKISPWIVLLVIMVLLIPFYYPYIYLAKKYSFTRSLDEFKLYSPQIQSFLAVSPGNFLYGRLLGRFYRPEAVMFPGIIALILVFWDKKIRVQFSKQKSIHNVTNKILNVLILLDVLIVIIVLLVGEINLSILGTGLFFKVNELLRPVYILIFLLFLKLLVNWGTAKIKIQSIIERIKSNRGPCQFYWILLFMSFLLCFGPMIRFMDKDVFWGPYSLFYKFVPGFKSLRVPGRVYVLFILSLSVLAGYGMKKIRLKSKRAAYLSLLIPVILLFEYVNVPFSLNCWIDANPTPVYEWLAKDKKDSVIVELPMPDSFKLLPHEIQYQYWSLYHDKKLVNGYSGFFPPIYWPLAEGMKYFPNADVIEMLKTLNVRYVVIHDKEIKKRNWPDVLGKMDDYNDTFALRYKDDGDYIYELLNKQPMDVFDYKLEKIAKNDWILETNHNKEDISKAIDNNFSTYWHSDSPQENGMYLELDLGKELLICAISMYFNGLSMDYPRGIELEVSYDGGNWRKIPLEFIYANYLKHLLQYPKNNGMILRFEPVKVRYIRIRQTGSHDVFFWSVCELDVYSPDVKGENY